MSKRLLTRLICLLSIRQRRITRNNTYSKFKKYGVVISPTRSTENWNSNGSTEIQQTDGTSWLDMNLK